MPKILVTGADGFIGSHLVEELIANGKDVRAFVFYNSFNSWGWLDTFSKDMLREIDVFAGDIRDPNGVRKAMQGWMKFIIWRRLRFLLVIILGFIYSLNIKGTLMS